MANTFSDWFTSTLEAHGYPDAEGGERFRKILVDKHGVVASPQAMSHWRNGHRTPTLGTILAILDAFAIFGDERDAVLHLAAGRERRDDGPSDPDQPTGAA